MELLKNTGNVIESEFELKWRLGVRSAMLISEVARRFASSIVFLQDGLRLNAKSCMHIVLLGTHRPKLPDGSYNFGPDAGARLKMVISGPDAVQATKAFEELFAVGERTVQCRNTDCISSAILIGYGEKRIFYSCSNVHCWSVLRDSGLVELSRFKFFDRT